MLKEKAILDWQIGEGEDWDAFEPLEAAFEARTAAYPTADRGWRLNHVLRGLVVVTLLAAVVVGYRYWRDYHDGITRIRTDIQGTMDMEAWAWESGDEAVRDSLTDPQAREGWLRRFQWVQEWQRRWAGDEARVPVVEIQDVELSGDVALVEVVVTQPGVPWTPTPYRETRFYRQVGDRWLRTAPRADLWGSERTLETDHFRFEFHWQDAETVEAVVSEVDILYADLRRDAGLDPLPADEKLTVEVVPRTDVMAWRFTGDRLTVPSSALLPVPVELPEAVRLTESVAYPLARRVVEEALDQIEVKPGWQPLVEGLRHWLAWEGTVLPSAWRYHVEGLLRQRIDKGSPLRLADVTASGAEQPSRSDWWAQIMAAETVVEYAAATYGRERLPALLRGLGEHENWDTLIPALFNVPADDFEVGWQAYLAARYGPTVAGADPTSEQMDPPQTMGLPMDDQPEIVVGRPLINDPAHPWPPAWSRR